MEGNKTVVPQDVAAAYAKLKKCRAEYVGGGWIHIFVIDGAAPCGCKSSIRVAQARAALASAEQS